MPRYKEETEKFFIAKIRALIAQRPGLTILEIKDILARQSRESINLDKNYLAKLLRKIRSARSWRINRQTLYDHLGDIEDQVNEAKKRLWAVVNDPNTNNMTKLKALGQLRICSEYLFDLFMDAGVFDKDLKFVNKLKMKANDTGTGRQKEN